MPEAQPDRRSLLLRGSLLAVALAALVWGFHEMFLSHCLGVFLNPDEDLSYGWFVPLFSGYVIWTERRQLAASLGSPSWGGVFAMLPFLVMGFFGARGLQVRFEIVAFAGLLLTLPWAFFGAATARQLLFPAGFLLFCVPLASFLDVVTIHLRLLASSAAYGVLRGFGADVIRQGTVIGAADGAFNIDIAAPCSGLRSIFALMALTAGYAYFNQPTWLRRALLFALSVPLAVIGNVVRILTICLVANYCSHDFATGFYHDYSGYVVFVVAILLMLAASELISHASPKTARGRPSATACPQAPRRVWGPVVAALVLTLCVMFYQAATPHVEIAAAPDAHLVESLDGFCSEAMEPDEITVNILPPDTIIEKRHYTAPNGLWFQVTLIVGGQSKSSIHRPEVCLPAHGLMMASPSTQPVQGVDWRFMTLSSAQGKMAFAYRFFNQDGYKTASHVKRIWRDIWDRSIHGRIDRWAMVTVASNAPTEAVLQAYCPCFLTGAW